MAEFEDEALQEVPSLAFKVYHPSFYSGDEINL